MRLEVGDLAPDFTLPSTAGKNFTLSEALESDEENIILFFYPGDFSTLCTWEACNFRDEFEPFRELKAEVIGISTDNMKSHRRFKETHSLPFQLLSDPAGDVCKLYGAYRPLLSQASRRTFVIDPGQRIRAVYDGLFRTAKHVDNAKKAMQEIEGDSGEYLYKLA
ncbi:MAG TPA: peroxiredoxin [Balneolales bacterium]|nr:peroxiredoxin [Balneolales bacterium]